MSLLESKWQQFAIYIYYLKLMLYIIFLLFLTTYVLISAPLRLPYRSDDCLLRVDTSQWDLFFFIYIGKFIVVSLSLAHMIFEVFFIYFIILLYNLVNCKLLFFYFNYFFQIFQLMGQGLSYFGFGNLLEWIVFILAVLNVVDDFLPLVVNIPGYNGIM